MKNKMKKLKAYTKDFHEDKENPNPLRHIKKMFREMKSTISEEWRDEFYTLFNCSVDVKGIWELDSSKRTLTPQEEERDFEFYYFITPNTVYILIDDLYTKEIEYTYTLEGNKIIQDSSIVLSSMCDSIKRMHDYIPKINVKQFCCSNDARQLRDLFMDEIQGHAEMKDIPRNHYH